MKLKILQMSNIHIFLKEYANSKEFKLNHECSKQFYVSPFIEMDAYYKFFNKMFKDQININIDLFDKNNKKVLTVHNMEN